VAIDLIGLNLPADFGKGFRGVFADETDRSMFDILGFEYDTFFS